MKIEKSNKHIVYTAIRNIYKKSMPLLFGHHQLKQVTGELQAKHDHQLKQVTGELQAKHESPTGRHY